MSLTDVKIQCIRCKQAFLVKVPTQGFQQWKGGKLIQDALPLLTADERELLISRTCSECFEELFNDK